MPATPVESSENHRRSLEQFILVSLVVLSGFTVTHWLLGYHAQALIQGAIAITLPPIYHWLKRGGSARIAGYLAAAYSLIVFTSLYVAPTINNTGIIWLVAYPLIVFFFVGTRLGLIWCLIYFILLTGITLFKLLGFIDLPYAFDQIVFTLIQLLLFGIVAFYYVNDRERAEALLLEAKQQSEAADHAKSEFLSVMSHELRTPIHGIIGMQELLAADTSHMNDEQREYLALAQQAAKSLRELVNDILDLSKVEAGALEIEQQPFELFECLKQSIIPFIVTCRQKHIRLVLEVRNIPVEITGDAMRLKQILINLIGNAVKFTNDGHIRLLVEARDNRLDFCIEDTGIGISQQDIDRIFTPFVQGQNVENRRQQGTGLGMSIVKRFVELMDGNIDIASVPNVGTRFMFHLPNPSHSGQKITECIDSTDIHPAPHTHAAQGKPITPFRVLLAEDDPIGQRIAVKRLSRAGIETESAGNGREAWEKFLAGSFDVLLTDIRMPDLDGMELTRRIREQEHSGKHRRLLIIGLSAFALEDVIRDCREAGMDDFITKPVDPETLLERVALIQHRENNGLPDSGDR
jgi:signal transduction histidine kinase/ActR/RegA family two-component response regulator